MPIWNPEYESMPRDQLEKLQAQRLRETIARVTATVPHYRKKFADAKVSADDIKTLDDLKRLPFTEKGDLRENYPFGMFTVPLGQVVRVHASSGTTGKPTVGGYTRADVELWAEVMARTVTSGGITSQDVVHNAYGYGLFTGGLGFHLGAERVGATVIPLSGGLARRRGGATGGVAGAERVGATVIPMSGGLARELEIRMAA